MKKKVLITGITGQDGSYLAEFLLDKGYEVHGIIRRSSSFNTGRIDHIFDKITLHYGDVTDPQLLTRLICEIKPDEIFNMAAQSHVRVSFDIPFYTAQVDALGVLNILEAVRIAHPTAKVFQASTSELFGKVVETPQKETTPFYPRSPYGVAKIYGYWIVKNYREAYNMFVCNGITFNHESPRRTPTFVTRKITSELAKIKLGLGDMLSLGNLDAKRDWGHAKEYVEAMWLMLQQEKPDDFVIATGKLHSVRDCIEIASKRLGMEIEWSGKGVDECGFRKDTGEQIIKINPNYFRPAEVDLLLGDASKAREILGWESKIEFKDLIEEMVDSDMEQLKKYGKIQ